MFYIFLSFVLNGFLTCLVILASAHTEEWDTKRLYGRLLGWAAMAFAGDLLGGRKRPESVSFH